MIKDQIICEDKLNFLQKKCFACSSHEHIASKCPLIHYIPDKIKVVKTYIRDPGHISRISFTRFRTHKFNSLFSLNHIKKTSKHFSRYMYDIDESQFEFSTPIEGESVEDDPEAKDIEEKQKKKLQFSPDVEIMSQSQRIQEINETHKIKKFAFVESKSIIEETEFNEFEEESKNEKNIQNEQIQQVNSLSNLEPEPQKKSNESTEIEKKCHLKTQKSQQYNKETAFK